MGRPPIGKVAMTGAERTRLYRLKHGTAKPVTKHVTKPTSPDHAALAQELAAVKRAASVSAKVAIGYRSVRHFWGQLRLGSPGGMTPEPWRFVSSSNGSPPPSSATTALVAMSGTTLTGPAPQARSCLRRCSPARR